jgi:TetR/AcrR family transcriptional regulator
MSFDHDFAHRDELLAVAIAEFDAKGYAKASLNHILDEVGMSKGQFYHHFANKEGLYFALIDHLIACKREFFRGRAPPDPMPVDVFELLRVQLLQGMAFARAHPQIETFARSFMRERGRPIFSAAMARHSFASNDPLQQTIAAALARGEFTDELSPAFIGRTVALLFNGALDLIDAQDLDEFERGLDAFIRLLRRALGRT